MNDMNENDFFETIFSFALVIRADVKQIQELKNYLHKCGITVCYQKTSTNKLFISGGEQP